MRVRLFLLLSLALAGCSTRQGTPPSLAPRAAEAIDPRVPVEPKGPPAPADEALAERLYSLVGQAQAGNAEFEAAIAQAERLAAGAGAPQSESWVVAQQALSAAVAARAPVTRAMGEIDAAAANALAARGGLAPADLRTVEAAAAAVGAIDRQQTARIDAISRRLGG